MVAIKVEVVLGFCVFVVNICDYLTIFVFYKDV